MKDLIVEVLDILYDCCCKDYNRFKKVSRHIDISGVNVPDILNIIIENKIPVHAYFTTHEYTDYNHYPVISWEESVPITEEEKEMRIEKRFILFSYNSVFNKLVIENGYTRLPFHTSVLKDFDDTNVYKMYIKKDFDRLLKYYSLYFKEKASK